MITTASESKYNTVTGIATGLGVDRITGIGGIPVGRITEVFGEAGVGKSTLCLQLVANAQKQGKRCLWADVEWSYETRYAEQLGVDNKKLGLLQERLAEDVLDAIEDALEHGKYDLIILDSIGGLLPRAAAEKTAGEKTIGGQAGLVATFCRKIVPLLVIKEVALVVINHSYTDIMSGKLMTSGGEKLRYHKSLSIRLKPKMGVVLKSGEDKVGKVIIAEIKKNKVGATEGQTCDMQLLFGTGFSASADILQDALDKGIIEKKGASFYLNGEKIAYGMPAMRKLMEGDLAAKLKEML